METHSTASKRVRVAIVGSGLTGLVATYLLSATDADSTHDTKISVEIFERANTLGMDSASISVPLPLTPTAIAPCQSNQTPVVDDHEGIRSRSHKRLRLHTQSLPEPTTLTSPEVLRIDVPMRAFTGGYYPQLLALYRHLGIKTKKTNFTYTFAALPSTASSSTAPSGVSTRSSSPDWYTSVQHKSHSSWSPTFEDHQSARLPTPSPNILYNGANGVRGVSLPSSLRHPRFSRPVTISDLIDQVSQLRAYFASLCMLVLGYLQLLIIAMWHHTLGHTCDPTHPLRTHTLRDLVTEPFPARNRPLPPLSLRSRIRYSLESISETLLRRLVRLDERFAQQTLSPLFSAVMTSSLEAVWTSPATEVLDYVALTLGKDHFVVKDGVRTVVAALLTHLDQSKAENGKVWTGTEVRSVQHRQGKAFISVVHHNSPATESRMGNHMERQPSSSSTDRTFVQDEVVEEHGPFDHVIFATQANQTARFLRQYTSSLSSHDDEAEKQRLTEVMEALKSFRYEKSTVVNHTDQTLLPRDQADWRDLNLVSPHTSSSSSALFSANATAVKKQKQNVWGGRRDSGESSWTDEDDADVDADADDSSNETLFHYPRGCGATTTKGSANAGGYTMATHILTLPSSLRSQLRVMQTTNPLPSLHPNPNSVLSTSTFQRAVIDVPAHVARTKLFHLSSPAFTSSDSASAKEEEVVDDVMGVSVRTAGGRTLTLGPLQRVAPPPTTLSALAPAEVSAAATASKGARVWVCGSWAVGIPLLEGCVVSARLVAEQILRCEGQTVPNHARW